MKKDYALSKSYVFISTEEGEWSDFWLDMNTVASDTLKQGCFLIIYSCHEIQEYLHRITLKQLNILFWLMYLCIYLLYFYITLHVLEKHFHIPGIDLHNIIHLRGTKTSWTRVLTWLPLFSGFKSTPSHLIKYPCSTTINKAVSFDSPHKHAFFSTLPSGKDFLLP